MSASIFIQTELINAFNNHEQTGGSGVGGGNRSVLTHLNNVAGCTGDVINTNPATLCLQRFNPFTDTPKEGVNWVKGQLFGLPTGSTTATTQGAFQLPRTYRLSVGVRF